MPMFKRGCVVLLLIAASACGGSPTAPPPPATSSIAPPATSFIMVTGAVPSVGQTSQLAAMAGAVGGHGVQDVTAQAMWSSSNTAVATVTAGGLLEVLQRGHAQIAATYQGVRGNLWVSTSPFHLTGIATDDDGRPVASATVTLTHEDGTGLPVSSLSSVTDGAGFYHFDFDARPYLELPPFIIASVRAESPVHERFVTAIHIPGSGGQNVSQNLHLYRITRITAGESTVVTVVPGDTNCGFSDELTCRTVRVVVPTDGLLTLSCPGLKIVGYAEAWQNPAGSPWHVTAGTEVVVDIGMWFQSTASQSCVFNTSLARL